MIGAEGEAAAVAVELIAAGAEEFAAGLMRAGVDFENDAAVAVFVVIEREPVEIGIAVGACVRGVGWFAHIESLASVRTDVKRKVRHQIARPHVWKCYDMLP